MTPDTKKKIRRIVIRVVILVLIKLAKVGLVAKGVVIATALFGAPVDIAVATQVSNWGSAVLNGLSLFFGGK